MTAITPGLEAAEQRFAREIAPTPEKLGDLKTAAWVALRKFNTTGQPEDGTAFHEAAKAVEDACETYREAYHPSAVEVFVTCDHERGQSLQMFVREGGVTREVRP